MVIVVNIVQNTHIYSNYLSILRPSIISVLQGFNIGYALFESPGIQILQIQCLKHIAKHAEFMVINSSYM